MSRQKSKTERQPPGQWPRHREIEITTHGYRASPNVAAGEPRRATERIRLLQGENDKAARRAAHRALDRLLDTILPQIPPLGPEWATWRNAASDGPSLARVGMVGADGRPSPHEPLYVNWHRVVKRRPFRLPTLACGVVPAGQPIISRDWPNWGRCRACLRLST